MKEESNPNGDADLHKQVEDVLRENEKRINERTDRILPPAYEVGTLELSDIIDRQAIQSIMDDFFSLTNIGVALVDLHGKVLVATGWQDICTQFHRVHPETSRHCVESDITLSRDVEPGAFKIYKCKNNMWDIATPVMLGEKHMGNLFLGQFFFEDELPDYETFRSQARRYGFNEEKYLAALERVPRWSRKKIDTVMSFYAKLAHLISALSYGNISLTRALTERDELFDSLRRSEQRLRLLVENMPVMFDAFDEQGKIVSWNRECERVTGYSKQEIIGNPKALELLYPNREYFDRMVDELVGKGFDDYRGQEWEITCRDGSTRTVAFSNISGQVPISGWATWAIGVDVTERKRMEEELRKQENLLRKVFEILPVGLWIVDENGKLVSANPVGVKIWGAEPYVGQEEYGIFKARRLPLREEIAPDDWALAHTINKGSTVKDELLEIDAFDGRKKIILNYTAPLLDDSGKVRGAIVVNQDITERVKAEEALQKSEALLRRAELTAGFGNWEFVLSDRSVRVSDGARRIYGLGEKEWSIAEVQKIPLSQYRSILDEALRGLIREGKPYDVKFKIRRPNDGCIVDIHSTAEYDPECNVVFGVIQDITERERAEQQRLEMERRLLHGQKLESLGVLAGGVAHDFNNLLMAVLGNLELALMDLTPFSSARTSIEQAVQAARRAADLTRQMLAYSGKGRFIVSDLNLSQLVEENVHMLKAAISKNVVLNLRLGEDLPLFQADEGQIQQIVMNLITNASEAIGDQPGTVLLSTGVTECDETYLNGSCVEEKPGPGRFVWLEVTDTGCGMDKETRQRLFDPFFTTKFMGRGLGMSAVLGIVRGHNGALLIDSAQGRGTTIRVLFPASGAVQSEQNRVESVETEREQPTKSRTQPGKVLVVDDEEMIRNLGVSMLNRFGFRALTAADGEEALRVFRDHIDDIVLVLLDLTMPRMDGVETFKALRRIKPEVRVILCSGYNEQEATRCFTEQGLAGFIQKPYRLLALRAELERVLQSDDLGNRIL